MMTALEIVGVIKKRRDAFWDRQVVGDAADPLAYSEADVARAKVDEYDDLLVQIGAVRSEDAESA